VRVRACVCVRSCVGRGGVCVRACAQGFSGGIINILGGGSKDCSK
jgi:hypothetical protein